MPANTYKEISIEEPNETRSPFLMRSSNGRGERVQGTYQKKESLLVK